MIINVEYDTAAKTCKVKADGNEVMDVVGFNLNRKYSYDHEKYSDEFCLGMVSLKDNEDGSRTMTQVCASEDGSLEVVEDTKPVVQKEIEDFLKAKLKGN